jgi:spore maturation protein CgeB
MKQLGYDIVAYGPGLQEEYSDIAPIAYVPPSRMTWDILLDQIQPDVAILNTRSRAWDYYNPFTGEMRGCWLPRGFESKRIPKVLIDEDSHYEKDDNWVFESNFQLTFQRHYSQAIRKDWKVKTLWLPFSVNIDVFKPDPSISRINKVCFTGSMTGPYSDRIRAIEALQKEGLIDVFPTRVKVGQEYVKTLQSYSICLSGASDYNICAAKNFEIVASGSVLLTNYFSGMEKLFDTRFIVEYGTYDVVQIAKIVLDGSQKEWERVTASGIDHIKRYHTDEIRTKQMIDILKKEL